MTKKIGHKVYKYRTQTILTPCYYDSVPKLEYEFDYLL